MFDVDRERRSLIALSLASGLGAMRIAALVAHLGSASAAWTASEAALTGVAGIGRRIAGSIVRARAAAREGQAGSAISAVDRELRRAAECGARLVTWLDRDYPARLRGIPAAPPVLYIRGPWRDHGLAVAIVGTRSATPYGVSVAEELSNVLALHGVTIISGLARGIDGAAHWAAVRAGGTTVGVLGCGVDVAYPPEHRSLMEAMRRRGALVAERPMGTASASGLFPARNRLISGLAAAVVVVEGDADGGAVITARHAMVQGRAVFAVPGNVYAPGSRGPHRLLASGASPLTGPGDVLAALGISGNDGREAPRRDGGRKLGDAPPEARTLDALPAGQAWSVDEIAAEARMEVAHVAAALAILELRGLVRRIAGGLYMRGSRPRA